MKPNRFRRPFPKVFLALPLLLASCSTQPSSTGLSVPVEQSESLPAKSEPAATSEPAQESVNVSVSESSVTPPPQASSSAPSPSSSVPATSSSSSSSLPSYPTLDFGPFASRSSLLPRHRTWYQLLTYSFADGNGDGMGDFLGIIQHLDYLENLGIGGIWLSPFHPSVDYHGYTVKDYYAVDSALTPTVGGVAYTLEKLIEECHKRDIKVLMDAVFNHTGTSHPWRRQHPEWYANNNFFGDHSPELDYSVPAVRTEMKNVGKYWVNKGIDGFRLDAAQWIFNEGMTPGDDRIDSVNMGKTVAWWREFAEAVRTVNPNVYMVGEVLTSKPSLAMDFLGSGAGSAFDFTRLDVLGNAIKSTNASDWAGHVAYHQSQIRAKSDKSIDAPLLSNHDIGRFNFNRSISDARQLKYANALNILAPGGSFVYYGEELGMNGTVASGIGDDADLNARTPMPFAYGRTDSNVYLGNFYGKDPRSTTTTVSMKTADEDAGDPDSMYAYTARLIHFKNQYPSLFTGTASSYYANNSSIGIVIVEGDNGTYAIIANSANDPISIKVEGNCNLFADFSSAGRASIHGETLTIPGKSVVVTAIYGDLSFRYDKTNPSYSEPASKRYMVHGTSLAWGDPVKAPTSGELTLHFFNQETSYQTPRCYAWTDKGTLLGEWPGTAMQSEGNSWYQVTIPSGASNVIFTNGAGDAQTMDLPRPSAGEYWFLPSAGATNVSGHWFAENPVFFG